MSCCSSPTSQRSSISCTRSPECHSPSTAATTPNSSSTFSPKIEQLQSYIYNRPSSPNSQELNYIYSYSPLPNEIPYAYAPPQVPSPTNTYLQPPPTGTSYQLYDYNGQQSSHLLASTVTSSPSPKYSGYPPASAFYGPSSNPSKASSSPSSSPSSSSLPQQSQYRRRSSERINPEDYKFETWYTADGRKVEYSPMHLNCATM